MAKRNMFYGMLIGAALGWLLAHRQEKWERHEHHHKHHPRPQPCPTPPQIADHYDESQLASTLAVRMAGAPADGSVLQEGSFAQAVWVDGGDEVLVHLNSLQVRILDRMLFVSVDLETDQTGRTPLVVALALGDPNDPAGLMAVTDELPRGHPLLAARWGRTLQDAVWASLLRMAQDHATERGQAPRGLAAVAGQFSFHAGTPITVNTPGGR